MNDLSHRSSYDPSRPTVGKMYRDAQLKNAEESIVIGDLSRELTTSLVEDINATIPQFDKKGKPYYLFVEEKWDLQLKKALARKLHYFGFRPYPEDNSLVFWKNPKTQDIRFCWCLPHWSEMDNTLMNAAQFPKDYIDQIRDWKKVDLKSFGFIEHPTLKWIPNPKWEDKRMDNPSFKLFS